MLFRGDLQGEPKPAGRMGQAHKSSLLKIGVAHAKQNLPDAGRSLLSLAVPERARSTQGIDLCLQASEQNGPVIRCFAKGRDAQRMIHSNR